MSGAFMKDMAANLHKMFDHVAHIAEYYHFFSNWKTEKNGGFQKPHEK